MPESLPSNDTRLILVTGFSGAGISSALKALEDFGYEVFDNFPISLIDPLLDQSYELLPSPVALGIDTRTRGFCPDAVLDVCRRLNAPLVFMDCEDMELQKRFTTTRRRHPMAKDRPVSAGIAHERDLLGPLASKADLRIDTTALSIHDLRRILEGHFGAMARERLTVTLMSFGFKNGLPKDADIVLDVRFLKNPHWVPDLKPRTGKDPDVAAYIETDPALSGFLAALESLLLPLLPRYLNEGKSYLTVAIGCTGGQHRSVCVTETLANILKARAGDDIAARLHVRHRDIPE